MAAHKVARGFESHPLRQLAQPPMTPMDKGLVAKTSIAINAPLGAVWDALVTPEVITVRSPDLRTLRPITIP